MDAQMWITKHFEELVDKYHSRYVAIVDKSVVSTGNSAKKVEEEAIKKYPGKIPSVIYIPKKEDLACLL